MSWVAGFVIVDLVVVAALLVLSARRPRFEVSDDGLRIRGNLYGRFVPRSQLLLDQARPVDFTASPELRTKRRTNGLGIAGFRKVGWFRLQSGEKALVFLASGDRPVYIPTTAGYSLLLGTDDPNAFLSSLKLGAQAGYPRPAPG